MRDRHRKYAREALDPLQWEEHHWALTTSVERSTWQRVPDAIIAVLGDDISRLVELEDGESPPCGPRRPPVEEWQNGPLDFIADDWPGFRHHRRVEAYQSLRRYMHAIPDPPRPPPAMRRPRRSDDQIDRGVWARQATCCGVTYGWWSDTPPPACGRCGGQL